MSLKLLQARYTVNLEHGPNYYVYLAPFTGAKAAKTVAAEVVLDIAEDGTLIGIELIQGPPPPKTLDLEPETAA